MLVTSLAAFLLLVGLLLPFLAWLSGRKLDQGFILPRPAFYVETIAVQLVLLGIALSMAWLHRIPLPSSFDPGMALPAAGVLLLALSVMLASWRWSSDATRDRLLAIVPRNGRERAAWAAVSAAAGIGEEVTYRAVLVTILFRLLGDWLAAALISSVIFALAHLVQGWKNAAIVAVFGFVFHLVVRATGSLAPAIAIHFLYDLITGYTIPFLAPRALAHAAPGDDANL